MKIAVCDRRNNPRYKNQEHNWSWIKERNRRPIRTSETVEEYPKLPKDQRDALKDQGGFVGGWLRSGVRKKGHVLSRCAGCLDADNIPEGVDFPALCRKALTGVDWFIYSTHKHRPEAPRFRLVILFDREVSEEEYAPLMRMIAKQIGMDYFDDCTYEAHRMMYWASCSSDSEFVFEDSLGEPLAVDRYLGMYEDWRDVSQWPTSSRQSEVMRKNVEKQEDPLNKEGLVGAFCRTYFPIQSAMGTFLSDVYAPTVAENRWDYIPAESTAGVVVYDDRFVYSHHATDPAGGKLVNAFDLVRIHKFGNDETQKSFKDMCEFALGQDAVKLRLDQERREEAEQDFSGDDASDRSWTTRLKYRGKSKELENSVDNLMLILMNDPDCAGFAFNEMAGRIQVIGEMPWQRPEGNPFWRDADSAQLLVMLDKRYVPFSKRNLDACFTKMADDRKFHPVREYLDALPPWDGVCRIETLLHRCMEADDTPYVRAVTRKVFAAAVARIYCPGTKFDSVLVLDGAQGIGKSSIFRMLTGPEYYSETLSLTDMNDKAGAEKLQGYWIAEIGELAGMKKADIEKVKAFLSTSDDMYRPSYGKVVESHPRQTVIIATVNGERGYLRDITGNRRFWVVKCLQKEPVRKFSFTPEERDQIWAEAVWIWRNGEKLYLEGDLIGEAEDAQRSAMEADERQGMVEQYLNVLLPDNWREMDLYERRNYLSDRKDPTLPKGTVRREKVCNVEIWAECFGRNPSDMKPADSYAIAALMTQIPGWKKTDRRMCLPLYGQQRVYERHTEMPGFLD
ncbi:MAG: virulence-associated E family protein [Clostridium sp.]|nr:virulence-associated E family protein [Clostridium sp.]